MSYRENESQRGGSRDRDRIRFDLIEHIGVLSTKDNGWSKEANIVAWNGGSEKLDIREWDPKHERMTKGITLFPDEAELLAKALADRYGLSSKPRFGVKTAPPRGDQSNCGQQPYGGGQTYAGQQSYGGQQVYAGQQEQGRQMPFEDRQPSGFAAEHNFEAAPQQEERMEDEDIPFKGMPEPEPECSMMPDPLQPESGDEAMAVAETDEVAGALSRTIENESDQWESSETSCG